MKMNLGVVFDFGYSDSSITKVYEKLDDENTCKEAMSKDLRTTKHKVVKIPRIDAYIIISSNSSQIFKKN